MADKNEYHYNPLLTSIAKELGLNPSDVTDMRVSSTTPGHVEVSFEGKVSIPEETFNQLRNEVVW